MELRHVQHDHATGLSLLRLVYTLVAFFCRHFVCFNSCLLLLFMDMLGNAGLTSKTNGDVVTGHASEFMGTLLALPVLVYGLAALLAMGTFFIMDMWNGSLLGHQVA